MAESVIEFGAPKICSLRRSLLQPYSLSARTNFTVGTIRSPTSSSSINLRVNSFPNLLKKSNLTTYAVAKKAAESFPDDIERDKLNIDMDKFNTRERGGRLRPTYVPSVDDLPAWGVASDYGFSREMEDTVVTIPRFRILPVLAEHRHRFGRDPPTHMTAPFFGVFDGHGGSRVAKYCQDHIHSALAKELEANTSSEDIDICEEEWRRALTKSFLKVDDEVGERAGVEPKIVGSTALVAIVGPSYIVVANCGDSRAVLKRERETIPLSVDHKSAREDEYARIEAACGEVIQGNTGYGDYKVLAKSDDDSLSNKLALSRAIGVRHRKPWVIPYPDVMVIPRTVRDICLILASDGLWDVMTTEEAGEMAYIRLMDWYAQYCYKLPVVRHDGHDPAVQAVADHLIYCARERGSTGDISVVVVDLGSWPYSGVPTYK